MGAVLAFTTLGVAVAQADLPDNDILSAPVGKATEDGTVVGSRQPTIMMQFNFGSTAPVHVECSADLGAFTSCGRQVTSGCPASQCWSYTPTFGSDGDHRVDGAIFDSTIPDNDPNQPLDELGFSIHIDSTLPDTAITGTAPAFDIEHENRKSVPGAFDYRTIDDADPILYEDTAQCAITQGAAPTSWVDCNSTLRVPLTTQTFRYWVRAVDFLGRPDPTPAESPPFSAIPCRSKLLTHPHSLSQIAHRGLRLRVACIQPARYYVTLAIPDKELIALNQKHRDIVSADLGHLHARTTGQGQTQTVTLHLLRGIPHDLFADGRLSLDLDTVAATDKPSVVHRVTGR